MDNEEQSQGLNITPEIANTEETRMDSGLQTQAATNEELEGGETENNKFDNVSNASSDEVFFSSIMTEELLKSIDMELEAMNSTSSGQTAEELKTCKINDLNVNKDNSVKTFCDEEAISALNLEIQKSLELCKDLSHYIYTDVTLDKDLYDLFNK